MPYVDSFRYYNRDENSINTDPDRGNCRLSNTDGSYGDEDLRTYICECCGEEADAPEDELPEGWVYSDWEDAYLCEHCARYCDGLGEFVSRDTDIVSVIDSDGICRNYPESYVADNRAFCIIEDQWYSISYDKVEYDGNSYILNRDE